MPVSTHDLGDGWHVQWVREAGDEHMTFRNADLGLRIDLRADSILRLRAIFEHADNLAPLVERVHEPIPADAIELYKGFVIRRTDEGFGWQRAGVMRIPFAGAEEARADIDLYLAQVDLA